MNQYPRVAAVILNYNGRKWLEMFLPFVKRSTYPNLEIVIGDNASTDDSISFLKEFHPEIRVIQNPTNGGFTKGYNDCLKQVQAEYYILLNSDIETPDFWIEPVIELMETDSMIGACQPKIKYYYDKNQFEYAGASGGFIDLFGYPFCRGRIFEELEHDHQQYNNPIEIFWATGACMFVRSEVYWKMEGLYEHLFAHMEEIDLCWRMKHAGYKIMVCPQSEVYHVGGGTLNKSNPRKTYYNYRNGLILLYRNLKGWKAFYILFIRMCLDGVSAVKYLVEGEFGNFKAVWKAHSAFYRWMRKHHHPSDKPKLSQNKNYPEIYKRLIIWDHYILKKNKFTELNFKKN